MVHRSGSENNLGTITTTSSSNDNDELPLRSPKKNLSQSTKNLTPTNTQTEFITPSISITSLLSTTTITTTTASTLPLLPKEESLPKKITRSSSERLSVDIQLIAAGKTRLSNDLRISRRSTSSSSSSKSCDDISIKRSPSCSNSNDETSNLSRSNSLRKKRSKKSRGGL